MSLAAMRWRTWPMEGWMAARSSGRGVLEGERGGAGGAGVRCGFSGGVVVVAEVFSAEAWAAAAVAVGEDVAALVTFGWFGLRLDGVGRLSLPPGAFLCAVF